jgi:DNA-binding XRE family transcriptional regulator
MAITSKESVSTLLKEKRKSLGLSQAQLAIEAGIDRKTVNRIENGRYCPTLGTLVALSGALSVTTDELIGK